MVGFRRAATAAGLAVSLMWAYGLQAQTAPSVATDREDYPPGSTAMVSGAGFFPGELVQLQVLRIDVPDNDYPEHAPWLTDADRLGGFDRTWFVATHEQGATLLLRAKGLASGLTAEKIFTDANVTAATGGGAIPADTYAAYTALSGPVITETIVGDISLGTIVLTAPAGFVFDTSAPVPFITLTGDNNNKNINLLQNGSQIALAVTTNTLSFTVTSKSKGQTRNILTYSNVRVRPVAPSPLASGNILNTGTSIFPNSTANFGTLTEVAGAQVGFSVTGFPSPQTAGQVGSITVTAKDQFGNTVSNYTGTVHLTSSDPQAVLPPDHDIIASENGTHTFNITLLTIGTQSITVSNMALNSFTGSQTGILIVPAPADHLAFSTQPGSTMYGSALSPQPVVVSQDMYGNNSTVGLGASKMVTLSLTSGSGVLGGTATRDIGTAAGNGTASFAGLSINAAGAGKQLTASASGLTNVASSSFTISPATVIPVVAASNKTYDGNTSATITGRSLTGVLGSDNVTLLGGTATFATKAVGNNKTVNVSALSLGGTSAGNYALSSTSTTTSANITPAALSVTGVSANNKIYDGSVTATLNGASAVSGVISGDDVTLAGAPSAAFGNKNVGTNKPVTASGYTVIGGDAGNYTLSQPTGLTANITAAPLTVSGITAGDKVYDGNTSATLNTAGAALAGLFGSDVVTLNVGAASGTFSSKNVGAGKAVTISGTTISGGDAANYSLSQPTTTASITQATLTVSGVTGQNRVYDGTTSAGLNIGGAALVGVLGSDNVTLGPGSATGSFATKTVGTAKPVTVNGLTISGTDAGNYALTQPTTSANITPAALTVTGITADNKAYDATTTATIHTGAAVLGGVIGTDVVNADLTAATGDFTDANVGVNKTVLVSGVTLSGTDAPNYSLTQPTATATIAEAALTVTGISALDKVYDSTTVAMLNTNSAALVGVQTGDQVTLILTNAAGAFDTKAVGTGKTVSVTGLELVGPDAAKYILTQPTTTASITSASLSVSGLGASDKVYDASAVAVLTQTAALAGVLASDDVSVNGTAAGAFADKNVGAAKSVSVSGLTLSGADAGNYTLSAVTLSASITPASLTVSGLNANDKVYDSTTAAGLSGSAALGGVLGTDDVSLSGAASANFSDKNIGSSKAVNLSGLTLAGADAGNYTLSLPTLTANITQASLTIAGLSATSRVYDSTMVAALSGAAALQGVLGTDDISLSGTVSGAFADKLVGTAKPVSLSGLALAGADAGNYALEFPVLSANITPANLTVTGITADNKAYDSTTAATIHSTAATLVGVFAGDVVTLNTSGATGAFTDANVGVDKTVDISGLVIAGTDSANYLLVQPTATATITPAGLTVAGITASDKVYDATTVATLNTNSAALVGVDTGDQVTLILTNAAGAFDTKAVGTGKTVTVSGLELAGPDAAKYTLTQPTTTASITTASLSVGGLSASDKVYDATTVASLTGTAALVGVLGTDDVSLDGTAAGAFADKNMGSAKNVSVSGLSLSGADAGNYTLSALTLTASITPAGLTVSGLTAVDKVYDSTTAAGLNGTAALQGILSTDDVSLSGAASANFNDKNVGSSKAVNLSGLTLAGADAGNYTLGLPTLSANITSADLTVSGLAANDKVYDAMTAATLSGTAALQGVVGTDDVSLSGTASGAFADKLVGTAKAVTVSGLLLTGADAGNYALGLPVLSANITPANLTVTGITADNKAYDSTTAATIHTAAAVLVGVFTGDVVTLNTAGATGAFTDANVGVDKTVDISGLLIAGTDSANYLLTQPTATATITPAGLTVTGITASDKVYDATTVAVLDTNNAALVGVDTGDQVTLVLTNVTGAFDTRAVGTGKTVTVSGLELAGPDAAKYTLTQPSTTASITSASLSVSGLSASDKVYDASTVASLTGTTSLVGVLGTDDVSVDGTAAGAFADKNVGLAKNVSVSGLTLAGADAGNYTLSALTLTASITPAGLTVSGLSATDKVYDSTTAAGLSGTPALQGTLGTDDVSLSGSVVGNFSDKNVGSGKAVNLSGLTLAGADAGNYSLSLPTLSANITQADLTVSGLSATSRVYDSTTVAALSGTAALQGVVGPDDVSLSGTAAGAFADKLVGAAKAVTVSGLLLAGADAGNYALGLPVLSANITPANLTVTGITADNKAYDSTTAATIHTAAATLVGVFSGDVVTLNTAGATGAFTDANVGVDKTVDISGLLIAGTDSANYVLVQPTATATITQAGLTVTGITASDKVYDATTVATLNTNSAALVGVDTGDQVTLILTNAAGAFDTKAVGSGKTVTVSGLELVGADAAKYTLTQPTTTASITAASLSVSGLSASDKVYDATTVGSIIGTAALVGVLGTDDASLDGAAAGAFADKNVGAAKSVSVSGLTLGGADAGNYTLSALTLSASITPASLTLSGVIADDKSYDGTTTVTVHTGTAALTGVLGTDDVTLNLAGATAAFADANAGANKIVGISGASIAGTDSSNYVLTQPTAIANILATALTVTADSFSRAYGQGNPTFTASFAGFVNNEGVGVLGGTLIFTTAAQADSAPGDYAIAPSGLVSANYAISFVNGTLTITTTNHAPVLAAIADTAVLPEHSVYVTLMATDPDGDQLTFSLDAAPAGAVITNRVSTVPQLVTNTVLAWTPTREQASSTNVITVRVTDNGGPAMSAVQSFTITVLDYVEITIGSTNVASGNTVAVPVLLSSSEGVTNLSFNVQWSPAWLSNAAIVATSPSVGSVSLDDQGTNLVIALQAAEGQIFQGTQQLASVSFIAISNQHSAFVPLQLDTVRAAKPNGSSYTNYLTPTATIGVLEGEPLLKATLTPGGSRELLLYGLLLSTYQVEYSTDLSVPNSWSVLTTYVQTNDVISLNVDSANPNIFYRLAKP